MEEGYDFILGVDEVGRGPLCGPVVTACCVLDMKKELLFLNDSKKLSEKKRDIMSEVIKEEALCYAFGESSPELIDEINILNATKRAMKEAIEACKGDERVFVVGGATVYMALFPHLDKIYVTKIDAVPHSDAYFPNLDSLPEWKLTSSEPLTSNGIRCEFCVYEKE